jgi:hypothetical protein
MHKYCFLIAFLTALMNGPLFSQQVPPPKPTYVPPGGYNTAYSEWGNLKTVPLSKFNLAMGLHQGILGMDDFFPEIAHVGMESVSVEVVGNRPTHHPIDGYKRPQSGTMYAHHKNQKSKVNISGDDNDFTMDIYPNPGSRLFEEYLQTGKTKDITIEGEIDINKYSKVKEQIPQNFSNITLYGPWVHEKHNYFDTRVHDYLEIHPCENIWWTDVEFDRLEYNIGVFSDNSGKFNKWRSSPVICLNAIAFEYTLGTPTLDYSITWKTSEKLVFPYPLFNDKAYDHVLMDGLVTILKIQEPRNISGDFLSIDIEKVSKETIDGKTVYKGFIKIHSAVQDGGHLIYSVAESAQAVISTAHPILVKVTLNDIQCETADDIGDSGKGSGGDNDEDLFGSYGVSAVTGLRPYHANVHNQHENGTLWSKESSNPLHLKSGEKAYLNATRSFFLPLSAQIVLFGNLDEYDHHDSNDKLGDSYIQRYEVRNIPVGLNYPIEHIYKSGNSLIKVHLTLQRIN